MVIAHAVEHRLKGLVVRVGLFIASLTVPRDLEGDFGKPTDDLNLVVKSFIPVSTSLLQTRLKHDALLVDYLNVHDEVDYFTLRDYQLVFKLVVVIEFIRGVLEFSDPSSE